RVADAFDALERWTSAGGTSESVHEAALGAAERASGVLETSHALTTSVLVGQIRSAAVDILCATGVEHRSAVSAVEEAAGRAADR
ncbi:MAG TPA: hypothetical protein PKB06_05630, partial [Actinotalea sp.]|nr:hypothetical protein [Actinotalea sp.]